MNVRALRRCEHVVAHKRPDEIADADVTMELHLLARIAEHANKLCSGELEAHESSELRELLSVFAFEDVAGANEAASAPAGDGQTADEVDRSVRDSQPYSFESEGPGEQAGTEARPVGLHQPHPVQEKPGTGPPLSATADDVAERLSAIRAAITLRAEKLIQWCDDIQLSNRLGFPLYANPGALKADVREVVRDRSALLALCETLRQELDEANGLLRSISPVFAETVAGEGRLLLRLASLRASLAEISELRDRRKYGIQTLSGAVAIARRALAELDEDVAAWEAKG